MISSGSLLLHDDGRVTLIIAVDSRTLLKKTLEIHDGRLRDYDRYAGDVFTESFSYRRIDLE